MSGYIERKTFRGGTEIAVYETQCPHWRARLATVLIERWGTVAAIPDGEDSAGRAKLRLQTPDEVVLLACQTADKAISEFEARGWVLEIPAPKPPEDNS